MFFMLSEYGFLIFVLTLLVLTALIFYFLGIKRGVEKGHWLGQKQALRWILPEHLRETDQIASDYIHHGTLKLKAPFPGSYNLGESLFHRLPIFADATFDPDK